MTIYDFLLKINGVDLLTAYGFRIAAIRGNWNTPQQSYTDVTIPGREGTTRTMVEPEIGALELVVTGELGAATESAVEDAVDGLKYLLTAPVLTVIYGNRTDRQRIGALKGSVEFEPYQADASAGLCSFTIRCENPVAYATTPTTVTAAINTDLALPMGTRRTPGIVTITTATNPLITYKHYDGTTVATMQLTGVGTFVVDMNTRRITLGGVRHDEALTGGDFFYFDPHDGDRALSHWPTLRTSAGTGGTALSVTFSEAFQ